jgi:hypothetical protein
MGEFVENRESDLPYDESIWFALVEIKDSKLVNRSYNSTAGNVGLILNILIDPEKMIPIFKLRLKRLETMTFKDVKELEWRERYKVKS